MKGDDEWVEDDRISEQHLHTRVRSYDGSWNRGVRNLYASWKLDEDGGTVMISARRPRAFSRQSGRDGFRTWQSLLLVRQSHGVGSASLVLHAGAMLYRKRQSTPEQRSGNQVCLHVLSIAGSTVFDLQEHYASILYF